MDECHQKGQYITLGRVHVPVQAAQVVRALAPCQRTFNVRWSTGGGHEEQVRFGEACVQSFQFGDRCKGRQQRVPSFINFCRNGQAMSDRYRIGQHPQACLTLRRSSQGVHAAQGHGQVLELGRQPGLGKFRCDQRKVVRCHPEHRLELLTVALPVQVNVIGDQTIGEHGYAGGGAFQCRVQVAGVHRPDHTRCSSCTVQLYSLLHGPCGHGTVHPPGGLPPRTKPSDQADGQGQFM